MLDEKKILFVILYSFGFVCFSSGDWVTDFTNTVKKTAQDKIWDNMPKPIIPSITVISNTLIAIPRKAISGLDIPIPAIKELAETPVDILTYYFPEVPVPGMQIYNISIAGFLIENIVIPGLQIVDFPMDLFKKMFFAEVCFNDIGCFSTAPPFYIPLIRPILIAPSNVMTQFLLFTPADKQQGAAISINSSLSKSTYDSALPVKFIIHGFKTKLTNRSHSLFKMKDAFLEQGHYNIFIVDWTGYNGDSYIQYIDAVANYRVVGAQIAQLIRFLAKQTGDSELPNKVHLIGHSLGAHVAGFAGKSFSYPKISRISGLDPAGPCFYTPEIDPIPLRKNDAQFVDIIHTDAFDETMPGAGLPYPIGHVDFYPNGGVNQEGCATKKIFESTTAQEFIRSSKEFYNAQGSLMDISCDHNRAIDLYIASINNKLCTFTAETCANYFLYKRGKCGNSYKNRMGFFAKQKNGVPYGYYYYLKTSGSAPFCV